MSPSAEPRLPAMAAIPRSTSPPPLVRYSAESSTPSTPALSAASTPTSSPSSSTPLDSGDMPRTPESPLAQQNAHLSPSPLPRRKPLPWGQPAHSAPLDGEDPFVVSSDDTSTPATIRYSLPPTYAPVSDSTPSARPPTPARPPAYTPVPAAPPSPETVPPASQYSPAIDVGVSSHLAGPAYAQEQLPGYASECETEPKTLARGLWLWGFLCPLLWLIGIWIMYIPLRPVEEEEDVEKAQKLEEMIVILRETELKYARRCAWAFTVFMTVLCCAIATGVTLAHVRR